MESQRRLFEDEIREALNYPPAAAVDPGNWTRIVEYQFSNQPLSSIGSLHRGGRFNIGNDVDGRQLKSFPALYIATDHDTAYGEYFGYYKPKAGTAHLSPHELALREPSSYSFCRLEVNLQRIFDLKKLSSLKGYEEVVSKFRLPAELRKLEKSIGHKSSSRSKSKKEISASLTSIDWRFLPVQFGLPAEPQIFGRSLRNAGFEGVQFRSTKGGGTCIAIFPDNLMIGSYIDLQDEIPDESIKIETRLSPESFDRLNRTFV